MKFFILILLIVFNTVHADKLIGTLYKKPDSNSKIIVNATITNYEISSISSYDNQWYEVVLMRGFTGYAMSNDIDFTAQVTSNGTVSHIAKTNNSTTVVGSYSQNNSNEYSINNNTHRKKELKILSGCLQIVAGGLGGILTIVDANDETEFVNPSDPNQPITVSNDWQKYHTVTISLSIGMIITGISTIISANE